MAGLTQHSKRVYVDGGRLIQTFLREGRLDELTMTRAPVLIGEGMPCSAPCTGTSRSLIG